MNIIQCDNSGIAFDLLDKYNVLKNLLPYIDDLKCIGKCKYHIVDAFTHMNISYKYFKKIFKDRQKFMGFNIEFLNKNLGGFCLKDYTAFATFAHDIGKFKCYKNNNGKVSFYGHNISGAKIANNFCNYFKFPKKAVKLITTVIEAHMYPLGIFKNFNSNYKKHFYNFFYKYDRYVPYILIVSFCDVYATRSLLDPENELEKYKKFIKNLFKEYYIYRSILDKRILKGDEIKNVIEIESNKIGKVIDYINKIAYINGIKDKDNIISYIRSNKKYF
jgi:poly(A) polymerase